VWLGICDACCAAAIPAGGGLLFFSNHHEVIVAFDYLTVPTVSFQLLYCFFASEHGRGIFAASQHSIPSRFQTRQHFVVSPYWCCYAPASGR
jgi:hypothetical protein